MPAIRSLHLPSSSICLLPERTIECLSFPCLFFKFATQPHDRTRSALLLQPGSRSRDKASP
jgi:hypothetical protein